MKLHYFDQDKADADDIQLKMAIGQGYVPATCLVSGMLIMSEINKGNNPCWGCAGPRDKCKGQAKRNSKT